ncbi:hypothetical protein niasHS_004933 [Heterodera schachtii]|uniref:Uncharacterized protein n=2 Tax=Heterodera TaxID=34509 RepID=A0ABD2K0K8_HETSC
MNGCAETKTSESKLEKICKKNDGFPSCVICNGPGPVCNKEKIELKEPFPPSNDAHAHRCFLWVTGMLYAFWLCFDEIVRLFWHLVPVSVDSQKSK